MPSRAQNAPLRTASGVLALGLALSLAACASLRRLQFERPSVDLEALEIVGLDADGVNLVLWLDVFNPNGYDIRTTRIEADLDLEDTHFGNALWQDEIVLAAASHTDVRIPANFTWEGLGAGARALLQYGSLRYDLETRLSVNTSFGRRLVTLNKRGEVPVRD
ncbi:MAG: LEA type 2 family protein [Gemmatimonadetes bacterium]|uniref:LEA type 2 family protein n=1 Tax=Candidatus Kutchimonas denitrificans TaxID=3056748 RepID=A0AAE4ZB19_9BACT|nr:LEA type 2 family protein [Gemmatimonadota bacterium]NIR76378.1 LEA type 2 family protein [Candidatus Kutchimonas denitrificans]NIS03188.1 LEA type 2 family protein [Gemmatimonadota bacterium]NIT66361.1 LEA type 2 family protein [Gemmatimonadota bacterium]NIU54440.1 hypothetical protein [Gemmatimonadota bacterium]